MMGVFIPSEKWWAIVERIGGDGSFEYWPVITWELLDRQDGDSRLVAWISGRDPIRSDRFDAHVDHRWMFHQFVNELPEHATVASWS